MAATFYTFEQLRKEYEALLAENLAKAVNEDADYWREQTNKAIRGPLRVWLAEALSGMDPDKIGLYLRNLHRAGQGEWRTRTEVLFAPFGKATDFPSDPRPVPSTYPKIPPAASMAKVQVWEKWLSDFEDATGQQWVPPYTRQWRPGWGTVAGALGLVTGVAVALLRPWR